MKNLLSLMGMLTLAGSFMLPSHVMAADKTQADKLPTLAEGMIGEVTFLLGRAEVTLPDGTVLPLAKDMEIPDGSRVLVKERSILRLTLADGGREKLGMPEGDTVFIFNKYAYDPANPQATQIRKTIVDGEVTSKTGEGGEKAKDRYRLNTPLAAIAVLGTEYTVRVVQGQTWVTVNEGEISIAKLGGSCQASGLGACVGGERLSENQRGLALVVRSDQPKPVFVPATAVPGANNAAASQSGQDDAEESSEDAAEPDEKASTEKTADKSADKTADKTTEKSSSEKTADKQADADKGEVKSTATTEKTADKATDKTAATEKTTDKASPVTTEKAADKTASTVTATASDKTSKTVVTPTAAVVAKVDERDFLAVESPAKTTTVEEKKQETVTPVVATVTDTKKTTATPVANVAAPVSSSTTASVAPTSVGSSSSTGNTALVSNSSTGGTAGTATLESKQTDLSTTTSVLESKQPSATSTSTLSVSSSSGLVSNSTSTPSAAVLAATPVLESTKPTLLVSPGSDPISGSVVTTSAVTPVEVATPLVSSSDGLVETSKTEATLTTDAGEVVAAVTPAPAEPVAPATPTTPVVDPATQPAVRWGKYDPTATVDASTTQGDQVSSLYEQLLQTVLGGYVTERQKTAAAVLPEQRDVTFALGSYEANVNNAATGVKTSATIGDARLSVSSTRNTYDTGFTLTSSAYTGSITSTGTFSSTDGTLKDDGTNPQTRLSGAVGVMGESIGAAYIFTHQIDPLLSAEGALNWTGTLVPASTASAVPVSPTTATVAVAPVAGTAIAD